MTAAVHVIELARLAIGAALGVLGVALLLVGAIGLLRFPDFYTRVHAVRSADALGGWLVLGAAALLAGDLSNALMIALLAALHALLSPVSAHMLSSAAHGAGLAPIAGEFKAPRPSDGHHDR